MDARTAMIHRFHCMDACAIEMSCKPNGADAFAFYLLVRCFSPEILETINKLKSGVTKQEAKHRERSVDVFAAGCVLYEVITTWPIPQGKPASRPSKVPLFNYKDGEWKKLRVDTPKKSDVGVIHEMCHVQRALHPFEDLEMVTQRVKPFRGGKISEDEIFKQRNIAIDSNIAKGQPFPWSVVIHPPPEHPNSSSGEDEDDDDDDGGENEGSDARKTAAEDDDVENMAQYGVPVIARSKVAA
jgi:hypothetical protein